MLHAEGLYAALGPIGQQPLLAGIVLALILSVVGGLASTAGLFLAAAGYNAFSRLSGGIVVEVENLS